MRYDIYIPLEIEEKCELLAKEFEIPTNALIRLIIENGFKRFCITGKLEYIDNYNSNIFKS